MTETRPRESKVDREQAVARYLELRPIVRSRMAGAVPQELRNEFESVTPHQLRALLLLPDAGLSMHKLASALEITDATASVLADRLVSQGLVERCSDPSDRRVVRLKASEKGKALAERFLEAQLRAAEDLFDRLSDEQAKAFLDVMETLASIPRIDPLQGTEQGSGSQASTDSSIAEAEKR